ncbi:MAG: O-antigen ligase family protein [Gammaproteobacteria bacterium]|nr:O-antigen ligase family protein [Gammaproteobacteria bacterium]
MATGHRQLFYVLVMPLPLLLWREILQFYRGNTLVILLLVYAGYMMMSLLWTANFDAAEAGAAIGYSLALLSFCLISGFIWIQYPQRIDLLARRATWLAAPVALTSILVWYLDNPFPASRLEPLGVMHHQNKAACAYGVFLLLCFHYLFSAQGRRNKALYTTLGAVILGLILLTQSRTALAGMCVGLVVLLGARALWVIALGLAVSWSLLAINPQDWGHRVVDFSFRPGIWKQLLADMDGHWWFGKGYLVDPKVEAYGIVHNHAHNGYLASLRDGGLAGLALILAILGLAGLWAFRLYRQRGERLYLALLLYGMTCISMDFDRLLVHPKEMWLFFWLPIALIMAAYAHRDEPGLIRYAARQS